jgi:hypothetical protein
MNDQRKERKLVNTVLSLHARLEFEQCSLISSAFGVIYGMVTMM